MKGKKELVRLGNSVNKLLIQTPYYNLTTSLTSCLKNAGIDVRYFIDPRYDAFLHFENGRPLIAVHAQLTEAERNFYLAHELGHLLLNYNWVPYGDHSRVDPSRILQTEARDGHESLKKRQANILVDEFARAFLLPDARLQPLVDKASLTKTDYPQFVHRLSQRFDVPTEVARCRVDDILERT